jgi:hypothetical protein
MACLSNLYANAKSVLVYTACCEPNAKSVVVCKACCEPNAKSVLAYTTCFRNPTQNLCLHSMLWTQHRICAYTACCEPNTGHAVRNIPDQFKIVLSSVAANRLAQTPSKDWSRDTDTCWPMLGKCRSLNLSNSSITNHLSKWSDCLTRGGLRNGLVHGPTSKYCHNMLLQLAYQPHRRSIDE